MSHISTLQTAKKECETTQNCTDYNYLLDVEYSSLDAYASEIILSTIIHASIGIIIGLSIILAPHYRQLQSFYTITIPKLIIIIPILLGLFIGAAIGFSISFSACYKQSCSPLEESAIVTMPLLSLLITIPIAIKIYSKRKAIEQRMINARRKTWVIIGTLVVLTVVGAAAMTIVQTNTYTQNQKEYLRNSI